MNAVTDRLMAVLDTLDTAIAGASRTRPDDTALVPLSSARHARRAALREARRLVLDALELTVSQWEALRDLDSVPCNSKVCDRELTVPCPRASVPVPAKRIKRVGV